MPDKLASGAIIPLAGVSSRINPDSTDPAKHVAMKWLNRRTGDPETGFTSPCYVCVDFTHVLHVYKGQHFPLEVAAEHSRKFIRADKLQAVVATMNAWMRRRRASPK